MTIVSYCLFERVCLPGLLIDTFLAVPLTEEEVAEKEALADQGFPDWNRRHFQLFIKGLEKHGRDDLPKVAAEIEGHTEESVRKYAKVFFERYTEIESEQSLYPSQVVCS